jgi:hypothetical protein
MEMAEGFCKCLDSCESVELLQQRLPGDLSVNTRREITALNRVWT